MATTKIQWTDRSWNFLRGCTICSPGCIHCYAMKIAHRFSGPGGTYEGLTRQTKNGPVWTGEVRFVEKQLYEPLRIRKPQKWFVNSMSDLFHEEVDDSILDKAFAMMALCPQHTFQILTKRPERMLEYVGAPGRLMEVVEAGTVVAFDALSKYGFDDVPGIDWNRDGDEPIRWKRATSWPLPNVWLGVSVEDQKALDRIDILKDVPAAVRFVSFEPLLEDLGTVILDRIHWAIIGGESGPGSRPCHLYWIRRLLSQCRKQNVAPFVKQWGSKPMQYLTAEESLSEKGKDYRAVLQDSKGGDIAELPEDIRVREFPMLT